MFKSKPTPYRKDKKTLCLLLPTEVVQIYSWVCSGCKHGVIDNYLFQKSVGLPDVHSGYGFAIGMFIFIFVCVFCFVFPPQAHSTHFASEKRFSICGDLFLSPPPLPPTAILHLWWSVPIPRPHPSPQQRFFICGDLFLSHPHPPTVILNLWWSVPVTPTPYSNSSFVVICSYPPPPPPQQKFSTSDLFLQVNEQQPVFYWHWQT